MIAAGDAGNGGAEADLSAAVEFEGFHEAASVVGVELQVKGEEAFVVEVAEESVPEISFEGCIQSRDFTFFEVIGFVCF